MADVKPIEERRLLGIGLVLFGYFCFSIIDSCAKWLMLHGLPPMEVVFVRYALPGEVVRARVTGDRGSYWHAEAVEVLEASPDRVDSLCAIAGVGKAGCCDLAFATPEARTEAAALGAVDFIEKPILTQHLLARVRGLVAP